MSIKSWIGYALLAGTTAFATFGSGACGGGGSGGSGGDGGDPSTSSSNGSTSSTSTSSTSTSSSGKACGNGAIDTGEDCDGANLNGEDCTSQGFGSGTLACSASCTFDTSGCSPCGNGTVDANEDCDGANLNNADCVSLGFGSGTLACANTCVFDTTGCDSCGNGMIDGIESCDGANLNGADCVSLGFGSGTLACNPDCTLDTSLCNPCGNGVLDAGEECDGMDFGGASCMSLGFDVGTVSCTANCTIDTSMCGTENCFNGVDDTNDGMVDCADPLCATECADSCMNNPTLPDPSVAVPGNTTGHPDMIDDKCFTGGGGGKEVVYVFTPTQTGVADIVLVSPGVDLSISVRTACTDVNSEVKCKDDAFPGNATDPDTEEITVPVTAGMPIFIVVEGYGTNDAGAYTLSAASRPIMCGDTFVDAPEVCDGMNVGTSTCANLGFASGTLVCNAMCTAYDLTGCTGCAHNKCTTGTKLNGACDPCVAQVCAANPACCNNTWDATCVAAVNTTCGAGTCPVCGDAVVSTGEHCDGANFGGKTCVTQGFSGGNLACNTCTLSLTGCTGIPAATETEQNGTFQTANPYTTALKANITAPVNNVKDFDFFSINVLAGQKITATVQDQGGANTCLGLTLDSDIAILGTDGTTQLAFNDDINGSTNWCSSVTFTVTTSGTYFIRVRASQAFAANAAFAYVLAVTVN